MRDVPSWLIATAKSLRGHQDYFNETGLIVTFGQYAQIVILNALIFIAWAVYNRWMFRGKERRREALPVTLDETAERFAVPEDEIVHLQDSRSMMVHYSRGGHLEKVTERPVILPASSQAALLN